MASKCRLATIRVLAFLYAALAVGWVVFVVRIVTSDWLAAGRPDLRRWASPRFALLAVAAPALTLVAVRWLLLRVVRGQQHADAGCPTP